MSTKFEINGHCIKTRYGLFAADDFDVEELGEIKQQIHDELKLSEKGAVSLGDSLVEIDRLINQKERGVAGG